MRRITWVALVVAFSADHGRVQADPPPVGNNIPIPNGPADSNIFVLFESACAGAGVSLARRDEGGGWWVWRVAGTAAGPQVRTPVLEAEYSRTSLLACLRPLGLGVHYELFLHHRWSAEVEAGAAGLAARLQWFPIEGVTLGLGFETRRGLVTRCRLGF